MLKRWNILRVLGLFAFTLAVFSLGVAIDRYLLSAFIPLEEIPAGATDEFRLMAQAWNTIDQYYVDRPAVKPQLMAYGAISGMANSLGDTGHTTFLTPDMLKAEREFSQGKFQGIGAEVQMKEGRLVIVAPMDNSPAQKAGLRPGDVILKVNGEDISGLPLPQAVKLIAGPAGSSVHLSVLDPETEASRQLTIKRAAIVIRNVTWHPLPGTSFADLRIAGFSEGVSEDLKKALKEIQDQGLKGIVLDLRNNPGGLLEEAVDSASQFLTGGNVLLEKDAKGDIKPVKVRPGGVAPDIPLVVLINGGTASAAEIVAGALQDGKRAELVGQRTFGTGTVLQEFTFSDGSALLLAVQEWLTPAHQTIWHEGITPNFEVALEPQTSPVFPRALDQMSAAQLQQSGDKQLLEALSLLSSKASPAS